MKGVPDRELLEVARRVRKIAEEYGALFVVNDRVDIALASNADGVHLGREDIPVEVAREIAPELIIGRTVRTADEAIRAEEQGADYLGAGSVYPSKTKNAPLIGLEGLSTIKKFSRIPVVAIGGIVLEKVDEVLSAGADGIAVVSAVVCTEDIEESTRAFFRKIEGHFRFSRRGT